MRRDIFEKGQQLRRIWKLSAVVRKNPALLLPKEIQKAIRIKRMLGSLGRNAGRIERMLRRFL